MSGQASNYELMKHRMRGEFLKYDQAEMIRRFQLESTQRELRMRFFGTEYRIDRLTGAVDSDAGEADYNVAMTIYDVLCNAKPGSHAAGRLVNMKSLSTIQRTSGGPEGTGLFDRCTRDFDHRDAALARACAQLGGVAEGRGDVSFRLPMFDFLSVMVQFWDSDEEFPPTLNLLVDENILDFMHYETVWFALSHLMTRLTEALRQ